MRSEHQRTGRDRHPWRGRAEIGIAPGIGQRRDAEAEKQHRRPVLAVDRSRRQHAGKRRIQYVARLERAQEEQRGPCPERQQHGVLVELQGVKVEERHQREQRQPDHPLLAVEIPLRQPPRDPQRERRGRHREQVIGPVGDGKDREPGRHHHRHQRRMLGMAEREFLPERVLLGHVVVDVLAALGDDGVNRPQDDVRDQDDDDRSLAPRRVGERGREPLGEPLSMAGNRHGRSLARHLG